MAKPTLKREWQAAARQLGLSTTGTKAEVARRVAQFGYDAVADKGRRQAPQVRTKHESVILKERDRKKLQATTQEQIRNHSLVAWMVRKHLDYTSTFHISVRTGNDAVDSLVRRIFKWHGAPRNLDIAKRLGRDEMFRMFECEKVVSGDAGLIKLKDLKLQGLESSLIANGKKNAEGKEPPTDVNNSGLIMDPVTGERKEFCICNRGNGKQIIFDHMEKAGNVIFDGYWTRFVSQHRGVSPLSTAINMVQDIHAGFEYNAVKAAMHALFGVAIMRDADPTGGMGGAGGTMSETADAASTTGQTELDLNPRLLNIIELNPGEDIKPIESTTPSIEFVQGSYLFIQIAMLALDIPVTAFDSRRSSFSARIADLNEYEVSAASKRTKNRYVRQEYSDWVLQQIWNAEGWPWPLARVAGKAKMDLPAVQAAVEWVPSGSPWLDKMKQVKGDELAIELHLDNAIDAARRRGVNAFRNIDKQLEVEKYERDQRLAVLGAELPLPENNNE